MKRSRRRRRSPLDPRYYWSEADEARLKSMVASGCATSDIASALGRSGKAVRSKASELGVSLVHYGRELCRKYPPPTGEMSLHKRRQVVVTTDFDFRRLTYDERLSLAEALRSSVPASYQHAGSDVQREEFAAQCMAHHAGVQVPARTALPTIDANGEPDFRHLDAAQIRELLGIPLAPNSTPPKSPPALTLLDGPGEGASDPRPRRRGMRAGETPAACVERLRREDPRFAAACRDLERAIAQQPEPGLGTKTRRASGF